MLTRLRIKNFKRFGDADVELGQSVVFIGPNNSGKTTALQALALWDLGLRKWNERRELWARYLAAKTEFWRSHRQCAGVLHFCSLGYNRRGAIKRRSSERSNRSL
jgi:predicted ATPase